MEPISIHVNKHIGSSLLACSQQEYFLVQIILIKMKLRVDFLLDLLISFVKKKKEKEKEKERKLFS